LAKHSLFFGRSEIELLLISIACQIIALFTLLRVATGIASFNSTTNSSTSPALVVPSNINQNISIPNSTPQFVSPAGSNLGGSFLIAVIFVAANVAVIGFLAFLYRRRKMKMFSLLISLFLAFIVTELYFTFLSGLSSWVPLIASLVALAVTILAAFRGSLFLTNAIALILALELGSSFPVLLQAPLNWIIPAVYAVFDIYAVYYGRLGKLVREVARDEEKTPPVSKSSADQNIPASLPLATNKITSQTQADGPNEKKHGLSRWPDFGLLSIKLSEIEIGTADIAFYTMVPAVAALLVARYSLLAFFVVMAAVDVGIIFSFFLFRKREVSPGLPVPILLGLGALFIVSYVI
jgi:presenilin-like A22 family membrane protease